MSKIKDDSSTDARCTQPFKCLGDPNTVAQNWTEWKKSFEYFLGASGIRNDARQKAMLLHMVGP